MTDYGLTDTEQRVMDEIARGKTYQQVADELDFALSSVHNYAHRIGKKIPGPQDPLRKMILAGNGVDPQEVVR